MELPELVNSLFVQADRKELEVLDNNLNVVARAVADVVAV